ncbi:MAG: LysR family transcriptional regulator [Christensenellales bacterium]
MNLKKFEYFLSVAELLNFTRAAERHFISQTAMSQQIASLESKFGVQLLTRDTKNVALTDAGRCLKQQAEALLAVYHHLCQEMENYSNKNRVVTIEYTGPIEQALIKKAMERFQGSKEHRIDFRYKGQSAARMDLKSGACDAVISVTSEFADDPDIARKLLARNPIRLAMSVDHPLAQRSALSREELRGERFIILTPGAAQQGNAIVTELLERQLGVSKSRIVQVDNIETQLLQISLGVGISLLPDTKELRDYGITFVPLSGRQLWHEVYFLYSRNSPVADVLARFLENL